MVAAGQCQGREVRTVEGLTGDQETGAERRLGTVQEAFAEAGAVQCGFCTPGLLVQADDLISRTVGAGQAAPDDPEIREALAGNLCRCTGYEKIIDAVRLAAQREQVLANATGGADSEPDKGGERE